MQGLFNELWANQDVISVNHVVDITLPVGFLIDYLIVPYPVHYRLHFLLLELQVWTPILYFHFGNTLTYFQDLEEVFRGKRMARLFLLAIR